MSKKPADHQSSEFVYTANSGETVTLPSLKKIMTFGRSRRLRSLDPGEQMFVIIEEIADEKTLAILDDFDVDESEAFFSAWQEHAGISMGESEGSST